MYGEKKKKKKRGKIMDSKQKFRYEDNDFFAKNMDHASTRFLDEAWGVHYVAYLSSLGIDNNHIDAIEDLEEVEEEDYYRLQQRLENEDVFQIEIWLKANGSYEGVAQLVK